MLDEIQKYVDLIKKYITENYKDNFREPIEKLPYKYLVPGAQYSTQLWDWDSWLTGIALFSIEDSAIEEYEKGCVLNFLFNMDEQGRIPIVVQDTPNWLFDLNDKYYGNIHKPCLAIHALEISNKYNDVEWLRKDFKKILKFLSYYENNQKHEETGLYYWIDDLAIGFDNDPTVFYRPDKSTGPIYLNSMMYSELFSVGKLGEMLGEKLIAEEYFNKASRLKEAIQKECFDKVDGFYYSVDLSLKPVDPNRWLHSNYPRVHKSLPIKITTWAGVMPMWNKIATEEQAARIVAKYQCSDGLFANFGIRSVAKNEKMYKVVPSGNPSCWSGPIWINANYMAYVGFRNYGYDKLADDIAIKTIKLLGQDIEKFGQFHEYYDPDTGEGVLGLGFQSWNFLVLNMIKDMEKRSNGK